MEQISNISISINLILYLTFFGYESAIAFCNEVIETLPFLKQTETNSAKICEFCVSNLAYWVSSLLGDESLENGAMSKFHENL